MAVQKMSREARNSYRKSNNARRKTLRRIEAEARNEKWGRNGLRPVGVPAPYGSESFFRRWPMATIFGKLFGAVKKALESLSTPARVKAPETIRATEKPVMRHGSTKYGRAHTKGASGPNRAGYKMLRRSMRKYGFREVMMSRTAKADK